MHLIAWNFLARGGGGGGAGAGAGAREAWGEGNTEIPYVPTVQSIWRFNTVRNTLVCLVDHDTGQVLYMELVVLCPYTVPVSDLHLLS